MYQTILCIFANYNWPIFMVNTLGWVPTGRLCSKTFVVLTEQ